MDSNKLSEFAYQATLGLIAVLIFASLAMAFQSSNDAAQDESCVLRGECLSYIDNAATMRLAQGDAVRAAKIRKEWKRERSHALRGAK